MPRDVRRDAGDELGQADELVARIVEAGDEQRHDFDPDVHRVKAPNRVEDRLEPAAELPVMPIVEALEIDLVEIDPRTQVLEHPRRAVPVRDEPGRQPGGPGFLEDRDRPFARDERLVVGADDDARALAERVGTSASGEAASGGATAAGSRIACDVTQFWQ